MQKSKVILGIVIGYSCLLLVLPYFNIFSFLHPKSGTHVILIHIFVYISLFITGMYWYLKEKALSSKEISFIAIYSVFCAIARIPFIALPSVQPCTYLIFCAGIVFGPFIGFMIGMNTALLSNFIAGHGPWTLYQIIAWGSVGIIGGFLKPSEKSVNSRLYQSVLSIIGLILGFFYGIIMNIWSWLILEPPLTLEKFFLIYLTSLPFDIAHSVFNFIFLWIFGPQTIRILQRYKNRLFTAYEPINGIKQEEKKVSG